MEANRKSQKLFPFVKMVVNLEGVPMHLTGLLLINVSISSFKFYTCFSVYFNSFY